MNFYINRDLTTEYLCKSYFGERRDPKQSARDAIVGLRQQLQIIAEKEEHLQKKIDEKIKEAKVNAVSNKASTLKTIARSVTLMQPNPPNNSRNSGSLQEEANEVELDRLAAARLQLEMQMNTLESTSFDAETRQSTKKAADALSIIRGTPFVLVFVFIWPQNSQ